MTRVDLAYYVSMLARGQANPCEKHERALRAVLRWLKHIEGYRQVVSAVEEKDLILRCYVDASWGSEKSVDRKSISGGCIFLGPFCLKGWTRLQQAVALSSAESELYALVEGAKEALGVRCAISHAFGWVELQQPWIYCDSEAACAISKADGLRKVRHIDLRACFIQDQIRQRNIHVFSIRGTENPADLFTKSLDFATTLKHMAALGLVECMSVASVAVSQSVVAASLRDAAVGGRWLSPVERYKLSEKRRWLLIESCAPHGSTMSLLGQKAEDVTVLTVSEEDDGTDPETLKLLKQVCAMHVLAGKKVFLWSSTPCIGGSPFQHLNLHRYKDEYRKNHLNHLWAIHRKLWKAVAELSEYVHGWAIEWPLRSAYWLWRQTKHFMKTRQYEVSCVVVDACMAGMVGRDDKLVHKRWKIATSFSALASALSKYTCNGEHEHSADYVLERDAALS